VKRDWSKDVQESQLDMMGVTSVYEKYQAILLMLLCVCNTFIRTNAENKKENTK